MATSASSIARERELHALIETQKSNFNEYLFVLRRENEALDRGESDKLDDYRKLEAAGREKIIDTARSLRSLAHDAGEPAEISPSGQSLLSGRRALESLRLQALAANADTQEHLKRKMKDVKRELDALAVTQRRLGGDHRPSGADPIYIDFYS